MCTLRDKTLPTSECLGCFASLRSEQGIVSLAPIRSYPLKAKGVTFVVTPFAYLLSYEQRPKLGDSFILWDHSGPLHARYSGRMAPSGQLSAHRPQCIQCSCRITNGDPFTMHCCGQLSAHRLHPRQAFVITYPLVSGFSLPKLKGARVTVWEPKSNTSPRPL